MRGRAGLQLVQHFLVLAKAGYLASFIICEQAGTVGALWFGLQALDSSDFLD
eukprot:m.1556309 g.1556309  ORF g.1556309 m.1556309 type:complete len:52 (-) comp25272_c2_seq14:1958-2113(-)